MRLRGYRSDDNLFWREPARGPDKAFGFDLTSKERFPPLVQASAGPSCDLPGDSTKSLL